MPVPMMDGMVLRPYVGNCFIVYTISLPQNQTSLTVTAWYGFVTSMSSFGSLHRLHLFDEMLTLVHKMSCWDCVAEL